MVGCASKPAEIVIETVETKRLILLAKKPDPIALSTVNFQTITIEGKTYIALTTEDYKRLIINLETIKKYMKEQKDIIEYYEMEVTK